MCGKNVPYLVGQYYVYVAWGSSVHVFGKTEERTQNTVSELAGHFVKSIKKFLYI